MPSLQIATAFKLALRSPKTCVNFPSNNTQPGATGMSIAVLAGQEHRFYLSQDSGGSAVIRLRNLSSQLQIAFECHKECIPSRIWQTKFGRYLAAILMKVGLPIDAITRPT